MNNKKTLVFIHGWGASSKIFKSLFYYLKSDFEIFALDLPGFGKTPIKEIMTLKDYAGFVCKYLEDNKIERPIIIGHSFGGAIATKLAMLYPENISKLVLIDASVIRQPRRKIILLKKTADILKPLLPEKLRKFILKLLMYDKTDYSQIESLELKETFKKIINEDLKFDLYFIKLPTLVIWGEKDFITPLNEGKIISENIPGAKLEIIKNTGHFPFLEQPYEFAKLIREFAL